MEKIRSRHPPVSPERHAEIEAQDAAVAAEIDGSLARRGVSPPPAGGEAPVAQARPQRRPQANVDKQRYLSALWQRFIATQAKTKLRTTRAKKAYEGKFKVFLDWFGDSHIEDVDPIDISEYKEYLWHQIVVWAGKRRGQVTHAFVTFAKG